MTPLLLALLLLACPLMMIFMMRGMRGSESPSSADQDPQQAREEGQLPNLTVEKRIAELEREFTSGPEV